MLRTHWSAEAWSVVRVEFRRALALRGEIRRGVVQLGTPTTTNRVLRVPFFGVRQGLG
jgi:hypothetical protein